jgi:DNA replication and repair protein RecF
VEASRARIVSLALRDFRNFERLALELPTEGLVFVGENGHGKTNLLESAYYLSLLRSVRGARDTDVVRFGADGFFIDARVCVPDAHELSIGFERAGRRKRVRKDGAVVERLSNALGVLPVVMFSPGDVDLVAGAPAGRRRFLDIMLALSSRGYLHSLQQYRAALERRNAAIRDALRRKTGSVPAIDIWEAPLATHGAALLRSRRVWVKRVEERFAQRCAFIGERGHVELRYDSAMNANAESVEQALAEALAAKRESDLRMGLTQVGPHRDDLAFLLDGRELRTFGSAGQQRTAARTLEADTLQEARDTSPVFLLDDPFAELDARRAERVLALLSETGGGIGQTLLAVPRDSDIPPELTKLPRVHVVDGQIAETAGSAA